MKVKTKEERENIQEEKETAFSDKLDVMRFVADIKLRLRRDITADFVLARLGDKDKEAIIEMTSNAYFVKKIFGILAKRSKRWSYKNGSWKEEKIGDEEKNYIIALGNAVFDSFMTRIYMTVILNRNVDKNYLINVLSGYREEEERDIDISPEEAKGVMAELMKNQESNKREK